MGKWKKSSEALKERFAMIVEGLGGVEQRQMFGYPCAFANGYLFFGLHEENMILRLDEADREAFLKKTGSHLFEPMAGRPMREYVVIAPKWQKSSAQLKRWLSRSLSYVRGLKPKTKRRSK